MASRPSDDRPVKSMNGVIAPRREREVQAATVVGADQTSSDKRSAKR